MQHAQLVDLGAQWLREERRCRLVLVEPHRVAGERPDAIGWDHRSVSHLVEAKCTVEDSRRDMRKQWRTELADVGLGNWRYFLLPRAIVPKVTSYLPTGWGLLVLDQQVVRLQWPPTTCFDENTASRERLFLIEQLRATSPVARSSLAFRETERSWQEAIGLLIGDGAEIRHLVRERPHPRLSRQKAIDRISELVSSGAFPGWSLGRGYPARITRSTSHGRHETDHGGTAATEQPRAADMGGVSASEEEGDGQRDRLRPGPRRGEQA